MFKSKKTALTYDRSRFEPAIRVSICTGEQVVGFRDKQSGRFEEIMLLRNERYSVQHFYRARVLTDAGNSATIKFAGYE